jgi:hypothetical protein
MLCPVEAVGLGGAFCATASEGRTRARIRTILEAIERFVEKIEDIRRGPMLVNSRRKRYRRLDSWHAVVATGWLGCA